MGSEEAAQGNGFGSNLICEKPPCPLFFPWIYTSKIAGTTEQEVYRSGFKCSFFSEVPCSAEYIMPVFSVAAPARGKVRIGLFLYCENCFVIKSCLK